MALSNTTLVPELQYWFNYFVVHSSINKYEVPTPVSIDSLLLPEKSFIELIFNESYSHNEYKYLYTEENVQSWPSLVRSRLSLYPGSSKYLTVGDTGNNVFQLKEHDFVLLDALLAYRHDSTSLTIVDSTSVSLVTDATANTVILYANYSRLNTILSKLLYLYLDLKIYSNYENYNHLQTVSSGTLLGTCVEFLLIDEYFKYISSRTENMSITC